MPKFIPLLPNSTPWSRPQRWPFSAILGKPRIYLRRGIWCCRGVAQFSHIGHGYTPREAFGDWLEQILDVGPLAA